MCCAPTAPPTPGPAASVQGMLSPEQLDVYGQLSEPARSFQDLGYIGAPAKEFTFIARACNVEGYPPCN